MKGQFLVWNERDNFDMYGVNKFVCLSLYVKSSNKIFTLKFYAHKEWRIEIKTADRLAP